MFKTSLFLGFSSISIGLCWSAADGTGHVDPRDLVAGAKITLTQALERARGACPGRAVQAELEGEVDDGKLSVFYEIMVVGDDGHLHEVKIDPQSGALQSNEDVSADGENDELAAFRAVLRNSELGLEALLARAAQVVNGAPVKAELELERGTPVCDVQIVNGRYLILAELEARAGHLTELALAPAAGTAGEHAEHEEHAGHGEGGEHGERHGERPGETPQSGTAGKRERESGEREEREEQEAEHRPPQPKGKGRTGGA